MAPREYTFQIEVMHPVIRGQSGIPRTGEISTSESWSPVLTWVGFDRLWVVETYHKRTRVSVAYLSSNHWRKFRKPQLGDETALILQASPNIWMIAWKKSCVILHPNRLSIIKDTANSLKLEQFQLHLPNVWFAKLLTSRWKKTSLVSRLKQIHWPVPGHQHP